MVQIVVNKFIDLILKLLAAVILIAFIYSMAYGTLLPQTKLDFNEQKPSVQSAVQSSADKLISNFGACKLKKTDNCICNDSLINFPSEVSLNLTNKGNDVIVDFLYNGKSFRTSNISNAFFSEMLFDGEKIVYENTMTFENVAKINGDKLVSMGLYKRQSRISAMAYKPKTAYVFGKSETEQKTFFDNIPEC